MTHKISPVLKEWICCDAQIDCWRDLCLNCSGESPNLSLNTLLKCVVFSKPLSKAISFTGLEELFNKRAA